MLYLKLIALADQAQDAAIRVGGKLREGYEFACRQVTTWYRCAFLLFWFALGATAVVGVVSLTGLKSQGFYQALLVVAGLAWASFLTLVMVFVAAMETLASRFKVLAKLIQDLEQTTLKRLKLPAWVAFTTLFLVVLVGRFPSLREPGALITLLGIGAAFGLASFLGLLKLNAKWIKRFIAAQLVLALVVLLIAPQFPHVTAWFNRQATRVTRGIGGQAAPHRVQVDPSAPPAFFDPITGDGLYYFSGNDQSGYLLWDGPGFDPATGDRLQKVDSADRRDMILTSLRAQAAAHPAPPAPVREPRRIQINSIEDIRFVDFLGSNLIWYSGSSNEGYELYDAPGYHRNGSQLKPANDPDVRTAILDWFKGEFAGKDVKRLATVVKAVTKAPEPQRVPPEDPVQVAFGNAAARRVAQTLSRSLGEFTHGFSLKCTNVRQTRTQDSSQGITLNLVVVQAQFRLDHIPSVESTQDTFIPRNYDAKATFRASEFYNVTDPKVVERIAESCTQSVEADREAVLAMRQALSR